MDQANRHGSFVGPKGAALRRSNFPPIWNAACARAGMPGLHFHDLRCVGKMPPDLGSLVGAGEGNRTLMTSLEG